MHTPTQVPQQAHEFELFTAEELAKLWKLDPSTVYGWARKGKLPPAKNLGKSVRFHVDDVREFVNSLRNDG